MELKIVDHTYETTIREKQTVKKYQTTDGMMFRIEQKQDAEEWQAKLDHIAAFKKQIEFTPCNDITLCEYHYGRHDGSFTFIMPPFGKGASHQNYKDLKSIISQSFDGCGFADGEKYLCIEYIDDSGDRNYYSGFIGKLSEYIEWLENECVKAKSL